MTEAFGYSTGTNRFGVEVVDHTGHVTRVVNRNQAINWSWGAPEENNSVIPQGGFVISTWTRQARERASARCQCYNTGDQVRSAVLSGLMDDEGKETRDSQLALKGLVEVLGPGQATVKVNGADATLSAKGDFTANVPLQTGVNSITVDVFVDEFKTNSKTFEVIRTTTETADPIRVPGRRIRFTRWRIDNSTSQTVGARAVEHQERDNTGRWDGHRSGCEREGHAQRCGTAQQAPALHVCLRIR